MRLRAAIFAVAATAIAATDSHPARAEDKGFFIVADEAPALNTDRIDLHGKRDGKDYRVVINRSKTKVLVHGQIGRDKVGSVRVPKSIDSLDLATARLGVYPSGSLQVRFRFGLPRPECFMNDDGRGVLTLSFGRGRSPEISITTFERCLASTGNSVTMH